MFSIELRPSKERRDDGLPRSVSLLLVTDEGTTDMVTDTTAAVMQAYRQGLNDGLNAETVSEPTPPK